MHVQVGKKKVTPLDQAIDVNESQNKAFIRTRAVFMDTVVEEQCISENFSREKNQIECQETRHSLTARGIA